MQLKVVHFLALSAAILLSSCATPTPQVLLETRDVTVIVPQNVTIRETVEVPVTVVVTSTPEATPEETLAIPPRATYGHGYEITEEFSQEHGDTTVTLAPEVKEILAEKYGVYALYRYKGDRPTKPAVVTLEVFTAAPDWQYRGCNDLQLQVDELLIEPAMYHKEDSSGGIAVLERLGCLLRLDDFLALVNANEVRWKMCSTEFVFTDKQMEGLRDLASRMRPVPSSEATVTTNLSDNPANGSSEGTEATRATNSPPTNTPTRFWIVETSNVDSGTAAREVVRVAIAGTPTRSDLERESRKLIDQLQSTRSLNAVQIFFYYEGTDYHGMYTAGQATWAPNGRWEDAGTVPAGDYSLHRLVVEFVQ